MADAVIEAVQTGDRNRLTTFFRYILAIPHLIVAGAWGWFVGLLTVVQWFIVVFTGKRNRGIFDLQNPYMAYATRVNAYVDLLIDEYPPFGTDPGRTGVTYDLQYEEAANRLSSGLRMFYIIPAAFIAFFVMLWAGVLIVISWFAILFTGRQPEQMSQFITRAVRFSIRLNTYANLMTDTYPKFA